MMERKDTLLAEKIAAAFAEKSQRKTRPRHLIAQQVSELERTVDEA
jgi:hypothetical protein